jgi:hypothetical protein
MLRSPLPFSAGVLFVWPRQASSPSSRPKNGVPGKFSRFGIGTNEEHTDNPTLQVLSGSFSLRGEQCHHLQNRRSSEA